MLYFRWALYKKMHKSNNLKLIDAKFKEHVGPINPKGFTKYN